MQTVRLAAIALSCLMLGACGSAKTSRPRRHARRIDFNQECNAAYADRSAGLIDDVPLDDYIPFYSVRARGRALVGSVFEAVTGSRLEQAMKDGTVAQLARKHFKVETSACPDSGK